MTFSDPLTPSLARSDYPANLLGSEVLPPILQESDQLTSKTAGVACCSFPGLWVCWGRFDLDGLGRNGPAFSPVYLFACSRARAHCVRDVCISCLSLGWES